MQKKIIVLGTGLTGKYLIPELEKANYDVYPTSRSVHSIYKNGLWFDLNNPLSWKNLPRNAEILWIFPPEPTSAVNDFLNWMPDDLSVRIVLGTTSVYDKKTDTITEHSAVDELTERVKSELLLLKTGSLVLRCAGLYSDERYPYDWLKKGLIKNGNKTVNLIHISDLAEIIVRFLSGDVKSEIVNVSDGNCYLWKNIAEKAKQQNVVDRGYNLPELQSDYRYVSNDKLLKYLNHDFKFHDEGWLGLNRKLTEHGK